MHPEVSAISSRLHMEERLREATEARRLAPPRAPEVAAGRLRIRVVVGSALVRIGTRLAASRPTAPTATATRPTRHA